MSDADDPVLSAQLSHLLVAFTVELDNEFEHQMPHRTTMHGSTPGASRAPWLVSFPMWVHVLRHVPEEGIPASELVRRSGLSPKTMQHLVKRLASWWGYLRVGEAAAGAKGAAAMGSRVVRPSPAGLQAQEVWRPLEAVVEARWRDRFGDDVIGRLGQALEAVVTQLDTEMPDYLPLGYPPLRPRQDDERGEGEATLPALLSKVLLTLARDFEDRGGVTLPVMQAFSLVVAANLLRVLDERGVRVAALPARTGVAKMAIEPWLGQLEKGGYLTVGADPGGSRFKVAALTALGLGARDRYRNWAGSLEATFAQRFGTHTTRELLAALEPITGGPDAGAKLARGMEPYPDGWRAQVARPEVLPDYPVVSARGGFPDGS